jgi:hypothetical protein
MDTIFIIIAYYWYMSFYWHSLSLSALCYPMSIASSQPLPVSISVITTATIILLLFLHFTYASSVYSSCLSLCWNHLVLTYLFSTFSVSSYFYLHYHHSTSSRSPASGQYYQHCYSMTGVCLQCNHIHRHHLPHILLRPLNLHHPHHLHFMHN